MRAAPIQIADRFYRDPNEVRARALSMKYAEPPQLIGWRTDLWHPRGIRRLIEQTFRIHIKYWEDEREATESSNGIFFTAFSEGTRAEKVKIHYDEPADWMSLLIYLSPNAAYDTGTSFWQHRETGLTAKPSRADASRLGLSFGHLKALLERDGWRKKAWIEIDRVGNIYNRALMFSAGLFHSATAHFGNSLTTGRVYQSFHFPVRSQ